MRNRISMLSTTAACPAAILLGTMLVAGCGSEATPPAPSNTTAPAPLSVPSASPSAEVDEDAATFQPFTDDATAVVYDTEIVPEGATGKVTITRTGSKVKVQLAVTGMKPRREYGAHVHTDPCGAEPTAAGPHYQHQPDPKAVASPPSVDPEFANPSNEVWLDFTTDATGTAIVDATQEWSFDEISPPRSVILHAEQTKTAAGTAGTAGPRVACLTLPI